MTLPYLQKAAAENDPQMGEFSICDVCAKAKSGIAPEHHVATGWIATCIVCNEPRHCTHVRDYRWPGGVRPTKADKP